MVPAAGSLVSARKAMGCAQWANRESVGGMFRTPLLPTQRARLARRKVGERHTGEPRSEAGEGRAVMERALWVLLGYAFSLQRPSAGSAEECNSIGAVNIAAVWVRGCRVARPSPPVSRKEKKRPKKAIFSCVAKSARDHVDVGSGATKLGAASTSCPVYRHAVTRVRRRLRSRVAVCSATTAGAPRAGKAANREIGGEAGLGGQRDAPVVGQCVSGAPRKNSTCL